jgi:hypothetical protein
MPAGRPTLYTEELVEEICAQVSDGLSLLAVCRDDRMPTTRTVYRWLDDNEEFCRKYARAREMQGHANAAMAVESAVGAHDAQLGRLAYDALKWHASKLAPKVYGDKTEVIVGAPNGAPAQVERVIIPTNDPIEAARVYQKFMSGSEQ